MGARIALVAVLLGVAWLTIERPTYAVSVAIVPIALMILPRMGWLARLAGRRVVDEVRRERDRLNARQRVAICALYAAALSTLVYRGRTTSDIASNALDVAGLIRLGFLGVAGLLAVSVLLDNSFEQLPKPIRRYGLYVVAVLPGIAAAVRPAFVGFRFAELLTFWFVAVALWAAFGERQDVPTKHLLTIVLGLVGVALVGLVASPGQALENTQGGFFPYRLTGVFPSQSANTIGMLGVLILAFGLARRRWWLLAAGPCLLIATQYRTGYVAAGLVVAVHLAVHRGGWAKVALVASIALLPAVLTSEQGQEAWTRGESRQQIAGLNSRTTYWNEALQVADRSPVIGTGLSSGTRFEALERIGRDATSTVHSTWVEAYTGTGIVGTLALGVALLVAATAAYRRGRQGDTLGLLVLTGLAVRSITAPTIELSNLTLLTFLVVCLRLSERRGDDMTIRAPLSNSVVGSRVDPVKWPNRIGAEST